MQTLYQTYYGLTKPLPDNGSEAPSSMRSLYNSLVTITYGTTIRKRQASSLLLAFFVPNPENE